MKHSLVVTTTALLALGLTACNEGDGPTAPETPQALTWSQSFDRNTVGWYGGATEGPLGFCGPVTRETGDTGWTSLVEPRGSVLTLAASIHESGTPNDAFGTFATPSRDRAGSSPPASSCWVRAADRS